MRPQCSAQAEYRENERNYGSLLHHRKLLLMLRSMISETNQQRMTNTHHALRSSAKQKGAPWILVDHGAACQRHSCLFGGMASLSECGMDHMDKLHFEHLLAATQLHVMSAHQQKWSARHIMAPQEQPAENAKTYCGASTVCGPISTVLDKFVRLGG